GTWPSGRGARLAADAPVALLDAVLAPTIVASAASSTITLSVIRSDSALPAASRSTDAPPIVYSSARSIRRIGSPHTRAISVAFDAQGVVGRAGGAINGRFARGGTRAPGDGSMAAP